MNNLEQKINKILQKVHDDAVSPNHLKELGFSDRATQELTTLINSIRKESVEGFVEWMEDNGYCYKVNREDAEAEDGSNLSVYAEDYCKEYLNGSAEVDEIKMQVLNPYDFPNKPVLDSEQNETPEVERVSIQTLENAYDKGYKAGQESIMNSGKGEPEQVTKPQDNIELKRDRFFCPKCGVEIEFVPSLFSHLKDDNKIRREEIEKAYTDGAEDFAYYLDSPEVNGELDDKAQRRFYYWAYVFQKPKEYLKKEEK